VELLARFLEIGRVDCGPQERYHPPDEGQRGLGILDARDVVRDIGPEARGRESLLAAGDVQDPDDPGGPLVPGRTNPKLGAHLGIGGTARKPDRAGKPALGEQTAEGPGHAELTAPGP